jgi:hypothetical protein
VKIREPVHLKRGKEFQKIVQADYKNNSIDGKVGIEEFVSFKNVSGIKQKSGRMDIIIHNDIGDNYVMIMEIKATDWDKIKPENIKRNIYKHGKQLYNYIDKFMTINKYNVGLALLYPEPPKKEGLKEFIEKCAMDTYSFPVYWYSEVKT